MRKVTCLINKNKILVFPGIPTCRQVEILMLTVTVSLTHGTLTHKGSNVTEPGGHRSRVSTVTTPRQSTINHHITESWKILLKITQSCQKFIIFWVTLLGAQPKSSGWICSLYVVLTQENFFGP